MKKIFFLLSILMLFCSCNKADLSTNHQGTNPQKTVVYKTQVNLNDLCENVTLVYNDNIFEKSDKIIDLEYSDSQSSFKLIYGETEYIYDFKKYSQNKPFPLKMESLEVIRKGIPIEQRPPKPLTYRFRLTKNIALKYKDSIYEYSDSMPEVSLEYLSFDDYFEIVSNDFTKKFYLHCFNNNETIDLANLSVYKHLDLLTVDQEELFNKYSLQKNPYGITGSYNSNRYSITQHKKTIAYLNNSELIPITLPNEPAVISYNSNSYFYVKDKMILKCSNTGEVLSRVFIGNKNKYCELLCASNNGRYAFVFFPEQSIHKAFTVFDTVNEQLDYIDGKASNYIANVSFAPDSKSLTYFKITYGYSEISLGDYYHYDLQNKVLQKIGGRAFDVIKWENNKVKLQKAHNGLTYDTFDSNLSEYASRYETLGGPTYPDDFIGGNIHILDEDRNILKELSYLNLLEKNKIDINKNYVNIIPSFYNKDHDDYMYFFGTWRSLRSHEWENGEKTVLNHFGAFDNNDFSLKFIKDITHLQHYSKDELEENKIGYYIVAKELNSYLEIVDNAIWVYDIDSGDSFTYNLDNSSYKLISLYTPYDGYNIPTLYDSYFLVTKESAIDVVDLKRKKIILYPVCDNTYRDIKYYNDLLYCSGKDGITVFNETSRYQLLGLPTLLEMNFNNNQLIITCNDNESVTTYTFNTDEIKKVLLKSDSEKGQ